MKMFFLNRSRKYWIAIGIVALLNFGFLLTNQSIGVDDENFRFYFDNYGIAMSGRYGYLLLMKVFNTYQYFPVWRDGIAIGLLIVGTTLFVGIFQKVAGDNISENACIVFASIVVTYPLLSKMFVYISINLEVALILVLAAIALYNTFVFIEKGKIWHIIYSILALTLGISMIENCLNYYVTGCFLGFIIIILFGNNCFLKNWNDPKKQFIELMLKVLLFAGISVLSIVSNSILRMIVCKILKIDLHLYSNKFILWDFSNIKQQMAVFFGTLKDVWIGYFKDTFYFKVLIISVIIMIVIITIETVKRKNIGLLCSGLGSVISVFIFYIITGNVNMVTRTFVVYSIFSGFVLAMLFEWINIEKMRRLILFFIILTVFYQSREVQILFNEDYNRYIKDRNLAREINTAVEKEYGGVPSVPVVFIGEPLPYIEYPNIEDDVNMRSIFSQNKDGVSVRIHPFFKMQGYNYISPIENLMPDNAYTLGENELTLKAKKLAENMAVWPEKGSVLAKEELVVVKLGPLQSQYYDISREHFDAKLLDLKSHVSEKSVGSIQVAKFISEGGKEWIYIKGEAYFTDRSSRSTRISVILENGNDHYIFATEQMPTANPGGFSIYDTAENNLNSFMLWKEIPPIISNKYKQDDNWKIRLILTDGETVSILEGEELNLDIMQ